MQIEFHDTGSSPRVPAMTDYFGFTMASLSETGSVFANPCKGEKNMSTLMFRPFSSWASNSEVIPILMLYLLYFSAFQFVVASYSLSVIPNVNNFNFLLEI